MYMFSMHIIAILTPRVTQAIVNLSQNIFCVTIAELIENSASGTFGYNMDSL